MRFAPLYSLVVERLVSELSLDDLGLIESNLDKLMKQRDEIVSQIYRTMRFLATVMILVFLLEIKAVSFKGELWGMNLNADRGELIFGLLLIGNVIALLFSTAMMRMFIIEFVLKSYLYLRGEGNRLFVNGISYRFFAFTFGLIAEQKTNGLSKSVTIPSQISHAATIVILPLTYILSYVVVLGIALFGFWRPEVTSVLHAAYPPSFSYINIPVSALSVVTAPTSPALTPYLLGYRPELWYLVVLLAFNLLTLSVYMFVFFPCRRPTIPRSDIQRLTEDKAYRLWDGAGHPMGRDLELWVIAERQIKVMYNLS
jgi:hypothetical protein